MESSQLSGKIAELVDCLRGDDEKSLDLTDVASVTEVLIGTMDAYFRSLDTNIYREFRELSTYIDNARTEIAELVPTDIKTSRLPRAGMELDAIVQSTEQATNNIMEATEAIMGTQAESVDAFKGSIEEHCMRIFEECSFQDITGQRISKVVETLEHIENRIHALKDIWGVDEEKVQQGESDSDLMRGPALANEGIDQSEIDSLLEEDGGKESAPPDGGAGASAAPEDPEAPAEGDVEERLNEDLSGRAFPEEHSDGEQTPAKEDEPSPAAAEADATETQASQEAQEVSDGASGEKVTVRRIEPRKCKTAEDQQKTDESDDDGEPESPSSGREATQAEIDALFS